MGDFNIAKSLSVLTLSSHVGTLPYMSPEMISHGTYSYNTDCWYVLILYFSFHKNLFSVKISQIKEANNLANLFGFLFVLIYKTISKLDS